jgi:amidase
LVLPEYSIAELQEKFASRELTAVKLCEAFLQRLEKIDRTGPTLGAVIEVNPDALVIAAALDQERQKKGPRGPLHGVPMMVKDRHRYRRQDDDHGRFSGPGRQYRPG